MKNKQIKYNFHFVGIKIVQRAYMRKIFKPGRGKQLTNFTTKIISLISYKVNFPETATETIHKN